MSKETIENLIRWNKAKPMFSSLKTEGRRAFSCRPRISFFAKDFMKQRVNFCQNPYPEFEQIISSLRNNSQVFWTKETMIFFSKVVTNFNFITG